MLWIVCLPAAALAVALVVIVKTARFKPAASGPAGTYAETETPECARKLAEAVRIATGSRASPGEADRETFLRFHAWLEERFPLTHARCEKTVVGGLSLLYRLPATAPDPAKKPVLITAHMDVVPVEAGTEGEWAHPPFGGEIADGFVWGRGTLDTKAHLVAALEAVERLLEKGITPARDVYLAFGHDEELTGEQGARQIAQLLIERGLTFDFVLDEGGCVVRGALPGIEKPVALVGVGEKGFCNVRLTAETDGGHASMPAAHTSVGVLAQAVCRLESAPFKPRLIPGTRAFLLRLGPYMRGVNRVVLANLWLFEPLFLRVFAKTGTGGALLRTTMAATMAQGGPAANVVPRRASAWVNCRILPGDSGETLLGHIRKVVEGLPVTVTAEVLDEPSLISPGDGEAFRFLEGLIAEYCGGAIVAPYLVMASTDARKYEPVCGNIYRFTPYVIDNADLEKIHGSNENISVVNVNRCVDFFTALMERL